MSTDMIERVTKAIDHFRGDLDRPTVASSRDLARVAIQAMREPTPSMIANVLPNVGPPSKAQRELGTAAMALMPPIDTRQEINGQQAAAELVRDFQAMIDTAIGTDG